jgi:hypothetical protein
LTVLARLALTLAAAALPAAAITFTGNVANDFTGPGIVIVSDGAPDVSVPGTATTGTVSGWDVTELRFAWNSVTDTLYVGIGMPMNAFAPPEHVIFGDADGDGNPGGTSAWLVSLGGTDIAGFGSSEYFGVFFDPDLDGVYEYVVGVPSGGDFASFGLYSTVAGYDRWEEPDDVDPVSSFGVLVTSLYNSGSPSASSPDFEFSITSFGTTLGGTPYTEAPRFGVFLFAGSAQDAGIGEDVILPAVIIVPEPSSLLLLATFLTLACAQRRRRTTMVSLPRRVGGECL